MCLPAHLYVSLLPLHLVVLYSACRVGDYVSLLPLHLVVLYSACRVGDVETVQELLPHLPEALNEELQEGMNLLMW